MFFLGNGLPTMELARLTLEKLSWPIDGKTTYSHPDPRFHRHHTMTPSR